MCGRYALELSGGELASLLGVTLGSAASWQAAWNVAPTTMAPVMVGCQEEDGPSLDLMRWGVASAGGHDRLLINARCETVQQKPSFREAIRSRRVVVPISAFYEWRKIGGNRHPCAIRADDGGLLLLAGLWTPASIPEGGHGPGFCILTEASRPPVDSLHDRMPVILDEESARVWTSPSADGVRWGDCIAGTVRRRLSWHPVSRRVNSTAHDGPELLERTPEPELESPGLFDGYGEVGGGDLESGDKSP